MNRVSAVLIASAVVVVSLLWLLLKQPDVESIKASSSTAKSGQSEHENSVEPVVVYCAASNRVVMERIRQAYEQETGQLIQAQYGPSQSLLASIEVAKQADLYIPADDSYLELARSKGLLVETYPLAQMHVVLAVQKGNPKQIESLKDLLRDDVRLVQANPDAAAVGKLTRDALQKTGDWKALDQATIAYGVSVADVANDLKLGSADAGFIYDVMLRSYPELEAISVPQIADVKAVVAVGVVKRGRAVSASVNQFLDYLRSADHGLKIYADEGFQVTADSG